MDTEPTGYIERLESLREEVRQILLGLDEDSLNWRPTERAQSIFGLAQHSAWYEQGMIGHVWGQQPIAYGWPTDETLPDADDDASDLLFMLDEAATLTQAVIGTADPQSLDEPLTGSQPDGAHAGTPRAIIVQVIEQYSKAVGAMRQTRQVWEASHGAGTGA